MGWLNLASDDRDHPPLSRWIIVLTAIYTVVAYGYVAYVVVTDPCFCWNVCPKVCW
jgi:hypothetical protein